MTDAILALNAGSSSLKFALFRLGVTGDPALYCRGEIENADAAPHFTVTDASGMTIEDRRWPHRPDGDSSVGDLLDWIEHDLGDLSLAAVGHRIVHGGQYFVAPVRLTPDVVTALTALTPLDPLHQPLGLAPIKALTRLRPVLVQIACFDTAFHHTLAPPASRYALPLAYEARGIRKYGFHGLSYDYIAGRLKEISPHLAGRRTGAWVFKRDFSLGARLALADAVKRIALPALRALVTVDQHDHQLHVRGCPLCQPGSPSGGRFFTGFIEGLLAESMDAQAVFVRETSCHSQGAAVCVFEISH